MNTYSRAEIESVIVKSELIRAVENGFLQYSAGNVTVPPVGHLAFTNPPGDVHIKYGAVKNGKTFTIKVSNGFYNNPKLGLPSSQGVVMVFSQETGVLEALLFDEGLITDMRTAAAGAVVAKYLAPKDVKSVGVIGTGIQARLQIEFLKEVRDFDTVYVYGRHEAPVNQYVKDMQFKGFNVLPCNSIDELVAQTNYIITTTPSSEPFLFVRHAKPGLHVTAMGADGPNKQEVDTSFFAKADLIVVDSKSQCFNYSDTSFALKERVIKEASVLELGQIIADPSLGRDDNEQITFADLTGVAVQDIVTAELIIRKLTSR